MSRIERFRLPVLLALVLVIIAGGIYLIVQRETSSCPVEIVLPELSGEIEVYVSGEVREPDIYVLAEGSQVSDAIEAAGGFKPDADQSINLARTLRDGDQVHVYKTGESVQLININTAESWLLDALPGIGEATAALIIEYREENGLFESIDDLKNVKGIGDSVFDKLKDKITVR